MDYSIKSRRLQKTVTFSRPGGNYIYVDVNGGVGTLGQQICTGGGFTGSTISYAGNSQEGFQKVCRRWWRQHLAKNF